MKAVREVVLPGWGLGRDLDMVELRGPGGAGERGGRCRFDRWRPAPQRGGEARRKLEEVVERVMEPERLLEAVRALPAIRQEVVDRVKAEIEAGTYETPEKLDRLAERLLEELGEG